MNINIACAGSRRSSPHATTRARFTLIEVLIATVVIVVAMLGAVSTVTSTAVLGETNAESAVAYQAARGILETIQATRFEDVIRLYNTNPADDPGPDPAPGVNFLVEGLDPQAGDVDGAVGRVMLPLSPDGTLRENFVDPSFGMPRDLTGDGVIDGLDHSSDHILLPVRIVIEWRGQAGDRTVQFSTVLGMRR